MYKISKLILIVKIETHYNINCSFDHTINLSIIIIIISLILISLHLLFKIIYL